MSDSRTFSLCSHRSSANFRTNLLTPNSLANPLTLPLLAPCNSSVPRLVPHGRSLFAVAPLVFLPAGTVHDAGFAADGLAFDLRGCNNAFLDRLHYLLDLWWKKKRSEKQGYRVIARAACLLKNAPRAARSRVELRGEHGLVHCERREAG